MLKNLIKHVASKVQERNPYFQKITPIAVRLKTGQVVEYGTDGEFKDCGISDTQQSAFYIRIDPKITQRPSTRQLTSAGDFVDVTVNLTLVAYNFSDKKFDAINMYEKLAQDVQTIRWPEYKGGPENNIKALVTGGNLSEHDVFEVETGQKFEAGSTNYTAISLQIQLLYTVRKDSCLADCHAFTKYC